MYHVLNYATHSEDKWGSTGTAAHIINLGPRWRLVVSFIPWLLYPWQKSPQYPLDRRMGQLQSQSRHTGEKKKIPALPEIKPWSFSPQPIRYSGWAIAAHKHILACEYYTSSKKSLSKHAVHFMTFTVHIIPKFVGVFFITFFQKT